MKKQNTPKAVYSLRNGGRHFGVGASVASELAEARVADGVASRHPEVVLQARGQPRSGVGSTRHVRIAKRGIRGHVPAFRG